MNVSMYFAPPLYVVLIGPHTSLCTISNNSFALFSELLKGLTQHLLFKHIVQSMLLGTLTFKPTTICLFISCRKLAKFICPYLLCHFIASSVLVNENSVVLLFAPCKNKLPNFFVLNYIFPCLLIVPSLLLNFTS